MRLLVLGGTVFLGRHLVEAALDREHEVTIFTRGQHNPELFAEVERLRGDRDGGLDALRGRTWDAVIDTSGYVPRLVSDSATLLADAVRRYVFISTISVYGDITAPGIDEHAPVATVADSANEDRGGARYGPLKALCEQSAEAAMPGRVVNVRAGLIVGPYDQTGRFTYWPRRFARGGEVLCPGNPARQVQLIDAGDLAGWCVRMAETEIAGTFNASGPDYRLSMGRVVETCRQAGAADARPVWVDDAFLLQQGVGPWMELPLWLPESAGSHMMSVNCGKAIAAGLAFLPLAETVAATLAWDGGRSEGETDPAGLAPEREAAVLNAWAHRARGGEAMSAVDDAAPDTSETLIAALQASVTRLAVARNVLEDRWRRLPPAGDWSAIMALAHLRATDDVFAPRLLQVVVRDNPSLVAFDERRWEEVAAYSALPAASLIDAFSARHNELLHALRRLPAGAWDRTGVHETAGPQTLRDIAATIAGHEAEHLDQIESLLAGPA